MHQEKYQQVNEVQRMIHNYTPDGCWSCDCKKDCTHLKVKKFMASQGSIWMLLLDNRNGVVDLVSQRMMDLFAAHENCKGAA